MPRVRRSLTELQDEYESGNKKPLEDLMRAWKGIKELPPDDPHSFFVIGGYHGEPFRGAGWGIGENIFWGGYCHHGNVLFPVWHRAYLCVLEEALRSIPGCEEVTIPFWDECSAESLTQGVPWALTNETFELDGETIANPLRSYLFPVNVIDHMSGDIWDYSKAKGYETVRYPYSGLVATQKEREETEKHNKQWPYAEAVELLNQNVAAWLNHDLVIGGKKVKADVHQAFVECLEAPNYTLFSNTTSATAWNDNSPHVVPLESPHNKIHLAVGGFDVPGAGDLSVIPGANGDMGENDTAGLDPLFYFHHCFIDRVFWMWQQRHGATDDLPIVDHYPGTNSADSQGATPGVPPNAWLSMDTPLDPFAWPVDGEARTIIGRDVFNIETQLDYTYGPGSLEEQAAAPARFEAEAEAEPKLHITGINRGNIRGSFLIVASTAVDGEPTVIGSEAVLSRWHVSGCANCQTHLMAGASFPLDGLDPDQLSPEAFQVEVRTRDGLLGERPQDLRTLQAEEPEQPRPFRVEVR